MKIFCMLFLPAIFCAVSCKKTAADVPATGVIAATVPTTTAPAIVFTVATYDPATFGFATVFETTPSIKGLAKTNLYEQSGIAASALNPGIVYVEQDSGNENKIYVTNTAGADLGYITLLGIANRDWEDIAVGPGPVAGKNYIYMAEIGDNDAKYKSVFIYRFLEPDLTGMAMPVALDISSIDRIELIYPDGARNAESVLIDPQTKDIYIASKESGYSKIYKAAYPQSIITSIVMQPVDQLPINKATSAAISADGTEILLRNKDQVWYWKRDPAKTIGQTLLDKPQLAPYTQEYQGEGVCFAANGSGFFTNTEVSKDGTIIPTFSFYKRK